MREAIVAGAWHEERGSFVSTFGGESVDASLLLLPILGIVDAQDPRFLATVRFVRHDPGKLTGGDRPRRGYGRRRAWSRPLPWAATGVFAYSYP